MYSNKFSNYLILILLIIPNFCLAVGISSTGSTGTIISGRDLHSILSNIRSIFPVITSMILVVCFVCGVFFIFRGLWSLHTFGQTQMNRTNEFWSPFLKILVGSALIYIPSTTKVFSNTIFGSFANDIFAGNVGDESNMIVVSSVANGTQDGILLAKNIVKYDENGGKTLLNYIDIGNGLEWLDLMNTVVMFIQMVGFIAFIRGWFIISHSTGTGAQQGAFGKGLIHLIGGVIAINFVPFMQTIANLIF